MTIFTSPVPIQWGRPDLPWCLIERDWHGKPVLPAAAFCLVEDPQRLWFFARHEAPANIHPQAGPGGFHPELWKHDVAEFFLADPASGRYGEFNLAANGAWWTCEFTAPRVRAAERDIAMPGIATFSETAANGAWMAAMSIPLGLLRERFNHGLPSCANVTFILGSPHQVFLSASDLGGGNPDFHQPGSFPRVRRDAFPSAEK